MNKRTVRNLCLFLCFLVGALGCLWGANAIRHDHNSIEITHGAVVTKLGDIYYEMYRPVTATETNKAPAVLLLHGYQNDHETNAAYAIELARRGVVVMSIDEYGHGATEPGLVNCFAEVCEEDLPGLKEAGLECKFRFMTGDCEPRTIVVTAAEEE